MFTDEKYKLSRVVSEGLILVVSLEYGEQIWHKATCRKHMKCSVSGRDLYKKEAYRPETNGYNRMDRIDATLIEKTIELSKNNKPKSPIRNNKSIINKKSPIMEKRTKDEINKEIKKLEQLKKGMPSHNAFGDNNHKIIEYQIAVLKGEYSDESEIDDITRFEDEEDDSKELNQSEGSAINQAFDFLNGGDELVSEEDLETWSKE